MPNVTFKLNIEDSQLSQLAVRALAEHLDRAVTRAVPGLKSQLQQRIVSACEDSLDYRSILGGDLWHELGIENPDYVLASLLNALARSVEITNLGVREIGGRLSGGLVVGILKRDLSEVLDLPEATFISLNRYGQSSHVDWLQWLLTSGEDIVLADFRYVGVAARGSRTGLGIMRESKNKGWSVPGEFAGTQDDNWLTRAVISVVPDIQGIFEKELQRVV